MNQRIPASRAARLVACAIAVSSLSALAVPAQAQVPTGSTMQPTVITHLPPALAAAGEPLDLEVTVTPPTAALRVEARVRRAGEALFATVPLRAERGVFRGSIPGTFTGTDRIEYYIWVVERDGRAATLPETSPEQHPLVVPIAAQDAGIVPLAPEPGDTVEAEPQIAALFTPPLDSLETARLVLDGERVEAASSPARDYVSYLVTTPLPPGPHTVRVEVMEEGVAAPVRVRAWAFTVAGEQPAEALAGGFVGRLSIGGEVATGGDAPEEIAAYFSEPPGVHAIVEGDLTGRLAGQSVSLWLASTPGFSPRTQGAILISSPATTWELGTLAPVVSDIALSGPVATGGRLAVRPAGARATLSALFVPRDDETFRYATWLGAVTAAVGPPTAQLTALAVYALEDDGTPLAPDGTTLAGRRGFTIAPRALLGPRRAHLDAQVAVSRSMVQSGANPESVATLSAVQLELASDARYGRATVRYTGVPDGYTALGAPYLEAGRREGYASFTVGRAPGFVGHGSYRVARFDSSSAALAGWTHTADAALSYLTRSGSGVTASAGRFDGSSYQTLSGVAAAPGRRFSATLTHGESPTTQTLSGTLEARTVVGRLVSLEGGLLVSRMTQDELDANGLPTGRQTVAASETTPRALLTVLFRPRDALELSGSYSARRAQVIGTATSQLTSFHQGIVRLNYVRSW